MHYDLIVNLDLHRNWNKVLLIQCYLLYYYLFITYTSYLLVSRFCYVVYEKPIFGRFCWPTFWTDPTWSVLLRSLHYLKQNHSKGWVSPQFCLLFFFCILNFYKTAMRPVLVQVLLHTLLQMCFFLHLGSVICIVFTLTRF